ncbi:MAG: OsmC family protein [Bacteroidota bacterium]|nr:OsmC family protein [Bacteroidota bacterium]
MAKKQAIIKQVQGITLIAKSETNHWVVMDGSDKFGGNLAGSSPKELLMFALGGCTAMDVIPILAKRKAPIENVEVNVSGNVREEHPQIFTELHVEYVFYGNGINKEDVERAIELSTTKYCAVSAMLKPGVNITHSYRIETPRTTSK